MAIKRGIGSAIKSFDRPARPSSAPSIVKPKQPWLDLLEDPHYKPIEEWSPPDPGDVDVDELTGAAAARRIQAEIDRKKKEAEDEQKRIAAEKLREQLARERAQLELDLKRKELQDLLEKLSEDVVGSSYADSPAVILGHQKIRDEIDNRERNRLENLRLLKIGPINKSPGDLDQNRVEVDKWVLNKKLYKNGMTLFRYYRTGVASNRIPHIEIHGIPLSREEYEYWDAFTRTLISGLPATQTPKEWEAFWAIRQFQASHIQTEYWDLTLGNQDPIIRGLLRWGLDVAITEIPDFVLGKTIGKAIKKILKDLGVSEEDSESVKDVILWFFDKFLQTYGEEAMGNLSFMDYDDITRWLHLNEYLDYLDMMRKVYESQEDSDATDAEMYEWILIEMERIAYELKELTGFEPLSEEEQKEIRTEIEKRRRMNKSKYGDEKDGLFVIPQGN